MLIVVGVAVAAFGASTQWLAAVHAREALIERAKLCAAALVPGRNGDLSNSVARLQSRYDGLVAVATLDAFGNVHTVHPDTPAHRQVVGTVLEDGKRSVVTPGPEDGEPCSVNGIVTPLNGTESPVARRALILFRGDSTTLAWVRAAGFFTLLMGLTALGSARAIRRWFDREVVGPLYGMVRTVERARKEPEEIPTLESGRWCETAHITELFEDLLQDVARGSGRVRQIARETQRLMHDREVGFDRQLRRARDQATLDPLTRVRNRTFYDTQLDALFSQHRTNRTDLCAVMIDIDNFKQYNDTKGHQVGDAVLRFLGALLRGSIRPTDHAIRYGGDEFLLLLPETTLDQADTVAQRLVRLFAQYALRLGRNHNLSISAGVASLESGNPTTGYELVANADTALYAAKRNCKGTVLTHPIRSKVPDDRKGAMSTPGGAKRAGGAATTSARS